MADCEDCGNSENVKQFMFYDTRPDKWLCWECRKPIVMDRVHSSDEDRSEPEENNSESIERQGQTALGEW